MRVFTRMRLHATTYLDFIVKKIRGLYIQLHKSHRTEYFIYLYKHI